MWASLLKRVGQEAVVVSNPSPEPKPTRRGVCALPYDLFQPVMTAYTKWMRLVEDPRLLT